MWVRRRLGLQEPPTASTGAAREPPALHAFSQRSQPLTSPPSPLLAMQTGRPSLAPTDAEARRMSTVAGGAKRKPGLPPPAGPPRGIPRPRLG